MNRRKTDRVVISITSASSAEEGLEEIIELYKRLQDKRKQGYKISAVKERGYTFEVEDILTCLTE